VNGVARWDGSAIEYAYYIKWLVSEFQNVWAEQITYAFQDFDQMTGDPAGPSALLGGWFSTPEEALEAAAPIVAAFYDEFRTWPVYMDHGYLPGESYSGGEPAYPPGTDTSDPDKEPMDPQP